MSQDQGHQRRRSRGVGDHGDDHNNNSSSNGSGDKKNSRESDRHTCWSSEKPRPSRPRRRRNALRAHHFIRVLMTGASTSIPPVNTSLNTTINKPCRHHHAHPNLPYKPTHPSTPITIPPNAPPLHLFQSFLAQVLREECLAPSVTVEEMEQYHRWKRGQG